MRFRLALVVVLVAAVAATPAAAAVKVTLTATTTKPKVGEAWRWTVTAREGGKPVAALVKLQIVLGDIVVGCWKAGAMAQCAGKTAGEAIPFRGRRTGVIRWPAESAARRSRSRWSSRRASARSGSASRCACRPPRANPPACASS